MSTHGGFELKSAYQIAIGSEEGASPFSGQWVWKANILPRIQTFVWMCLHSSIGVKECLTKRGVPVDPTCPLCLCEFESIIHALRDCRIIRNIWTQLGAKEINSSLFNGTLQHWITTNEKIDTKKHRDHPHGKPPSFSQFGAFGSIGTMLYSTIKPSNKTWVMRYSEKLWSTSIV